MSQKFSPTSWREICGLLNGVDGVQSSAQHKMASGGGNSGKVGVSSSVVVKTIIYITLLWIYVRDYYLF